MLRLSGKITGKPRWWTLNVALEQARFAAGDVLGLVAEIEGPGGQQIEALVRSRRIDAEGNRDIGDTPIKEPLALTGRRSLSVLLHRVARGQRMAGTEAFHTLILRLPLVDIAELTVFDLQIFQLPEGAGVPEAKTLASFRA